MFTGFAHEKMERDEMGGHSSDGRVQASQAWCRGFEPRCPLQLDFAEVWPDSLFEVISPKLSRMVDLLRIADLVLILILTYELS